LHRPTSPDILEFPAVTLADIQSAAQRLKGHILPTPCLPSQTLSQITGAEVFLKFENLQFTASFKERGACNCLALLDAAARGRGVIAMSAGNHAQGVAYHCQRLGIPAVIVMPKNTSAVKVERTEGFGATVITHGDTLEEAREKAYALARERNLTFVHPYDDPAVIAGQGTIALEMLEEVPDLDLLVISVGGGGLIAGMATAAKALKPSIEVVGVQTRRFPAMYNLIKGTSLAQGESTIADGIAVGLPGTLTRQVVAASVNDLVLVEEPDLEQAIVMLLEVEKTLVEGAGAAGLAALLAHRERFRGRKVGLVLCGGNIDPLLLSAIIGHGLVRAGRLVRLKVSTRDVPGSLAKITTAVGQAGANIEEVHHQRAFSSLSAQYVEIELVLQTRGPAHVTEVLAALRGAGLRAEAV
jgi:threonine dehydratase